MIVGGRRIDLPAGGVGPELLARSRHPAHARCACRARRRTPCRRRSSAASAARRVAFASCRPSASSPLVLAPLRAASCRNVGQSARSGGRALRPDHRPGLLPSETRVVSCSGRRLRHAGRRQGLEPAELGLQLAAAGVHRGVGHAVAGHDAVDAAAADPVIRLPVFLLQVDELGAVAAGEQKRPAGLGRIAAMVEPVELHVGRELALTSRRSSGS